MTMHTKLIETLEQERATLQEQVDALTTAVSALRGVSTKASTAAGAKKVTRNWSPAARKAAADRMRRYWAARRRSSK